MLPNRTFVLYKSLLLLGSSKNVSCAVLYSPSLVARANTEGTTEKDAGWHELVKVRSWLAYSVLLDGKVNPVRSKRAVWVF